MKPPPSTGIGWRHPHYAELLQARPALDFIEVHSENFFGEGGAALAVLAQGREHYPVSLHGVGLALGSAAGVDPWHLEQLARLAGRIEPVRVSDHACFARAAMGGATVHASDLLPIPFNAEALDVLCRNVQQVQERLKRPLLVENLSAYLTPAGSDRGETEFLNALVQRTGCGLLVDVNNIYVNALNARLGGGEADPVQSCIDWLDAIAPASVGEIHLAGHCAMDDIVIDDHGSRVCDPVWQVYRHALSRFGAVPTLVEWDTAIPPLPVLLHEAQLAREAALEEVAA
ncbi:MAG: DUF692 domain-containing protein [Burkholderiales bacterium]|nr:DUF692 domain-containing protein [Burkholderiales bacterium]